MGLSVIVGIDVRKYWWGQLWVIHSSIRVIFVVNSVWNVPINLCGWWFNSPSDLLCHFANDKIASILAYPVSHRQFPHVCSNSPEVFVCVKCIVLVVIKSSQQRTVKKELGKLVSWNTVSRLPLDRYMVFIHCFFRLCFTLSSWRPPIPSLAWTMRSLSAVLISEFSHLITNHGVTLQVCMLPWGYFPVLYVTMGINPTCGTRRIHLCNHRSTLQTFVHMCYTLQVCMQPYWYTPGMHVTIGIHRCTCGAMLQACM